MSLINDALNRAKAAQQPAAPTPALQFRPVEVPPRRSPGIGWGVPVSVAIVAVAAVVILRHPHQTTVAAARPMPSAPTAAIPGSAPVPPQAAKPEPAFEPAPTPEPAAELAQEPAAPGTETAVQETPSAPAVPEPPKAAPPKLQAIVFNPARPSAIINGKSVFVGDKVGEFRVANIEQDSATVTRGGETNLLTLEQ
jgi:hypothetical protein